MKKIILLISLIFIIHANAIEEKNISSVMQEKIDLATTILLNDKGSLKQKANKIFDELENVFDIKLMGRLSLGKYWKTLTSEQKDSFTKAFDIYMKESYVNNLGLYNGEKIQVTEVKKVKKNRIKLFSEIHGEKEIFKVIYKFYKSKSNGWLIYDVDVLGVSIVKTYKAQFNDAIANNSFEYLLNKIRKTP